MSEKQVTVELDDQHLYDGAVYGPGPVTVSESLAKILQASHERVVKNRGSGPVIKPHGVMTGVLPGTEGPGSNIFTPADAVKQREASEAAANAEKTREDLAKKAASEPRTAQAPPAPVGVVKK